MKNLLSSHHIYIWIWDTHTPSNKIKQTHSHKMCSSRITPFIKSNFWAQIFPDLLFVCADADALGELLFGRLLCALSCFFYLIYSRRHCPNAALRYQRRQIIVFVRMIHCVDEWTIFPTNHNIQIQISLFTSLIAPKRIYQNYIL